MVSRMRRVLARNLGLAACVVATLAGRVGVADAASVSASRKRKAAGFVASFKSKVTTPPKSPPNCRFASSCCGWSGNPG